LIARAWLLCRTGRRGLTLTPLRRRLYQTGITISV